MTQSEMNDMRRAGKMVRDVLVSMVKLAQPGITPASLAKIAEHKTRAGGCEPSCKGYFGFPSAICISVNDVVVHGVPSDVPLKDGDIVKFDFVASYNGMHADSAVTVGVGKLSEENLKLLRATRTALYRAIEAAGPGIPACMVSLAVATVAQQNGYEAAHDYQGHGIGNRMHMAPDIPNTFLDAHPTPLKPRTAIAIEPMFCAGSGATKLLADKWSAATQDGGMAAHFEHTVLILDDGIEIVTEWDEQDRKLLVPIL